MSAARAAEYLVEWEAEVRLPGPAPATAAVAAATTQGARLRHQYSWEPASALRCPELIEAYWLRQLQDRTQHELRCLRREDFDRRLRAVREQRRVQAQKQ